ncbi:hypothetical protein PHYPSEUDO_008034 [Phytophthora pseudosyringae]|uniref:Sfi1 spindle body domain-containing protein n=1 Tax=Phytophthora pseudosyringae TaxID=221518 RepID=A0A8T1VG07_9STRA|nr:hypothetical protein PHYPSEUDO_008034 [Phytophthora pseudosyringae]
MLRLRAEFLKENHERSMLRTAVWYPWRRKYQCSVALRKFTAKQQAKQVRKYWMAFALAVNQQEQQRLMIERIAVTREVRELRRHKRTAIAYDRRRRLVGSWGRWHRHFTARRRRHEADVYFRRRAKQKAVHLLHVAAAHSIASRHQRLDTEAWHEAVVLQRVLSNWFVAARHARRCRSLGECLGWNGVGRRAFRVWQDGWVEKQKLLRAAEFHSSVLVTRSWNALLRVTKRRQVALAMWSHSMMRIRLGDVFMNWKRFVDGRRGQYAVAASMYRMQEHRTRQRLFTAWALLGTSRMMALRREQSELIRWRQACWAHWKLWRVSRRWQRSQQLTLLRKSFSRGLQRYAIQQQARREICAQTARNLLQRSLAQWRVEWWLVRNQKKATTEAKRNALTHWKTFVVACRQKRRWEHYVQHLHRSETRTAFDQKRRANGDTFRDSRALQAQLKRSRVLMTHVLHAWYLVVQNRRRRTQTRALAMARKSRRSPMRPRQIALEFWARRVMGTCFSSWREQAVGQAERKLFG